MAYSEDDLTTLRKALAAGVRRVKFADREVEYASVDELRKAIQDVERGMASEAGTVRRRVIRVYTGSGL